MLNRKVEAAAEPRLRILRARGDGKIQREGSTMKLVTFELATPLGAVRRLGALIDSRQDGRIADLTASYESHLATETDEPLPAGLAALRTPPDMIAWLKGARPSREAAERAVAHVRRRIEAERSPAGANGARLVYQAEEVKLLAPIPRPYTLKDFSTYADHMTRSERQPTKRAAWYKFPAYYKGNPDNVVGPGAPIPYPYYTKSLDLEIEIGIIVGKQGSDLTVEEAKNYIAGYTILVDPSCRDGYEREPFGQTKRKDFCTALGPCIVTADEIDENNLKAKITVDGEVWFEGNTGAPRNFLPAHLLAYASDNETIYPGDVIGTGTIGFGCSMDLHKWIKVGQTASFEIEGIGTMTHTIVPGRHIVDHVNGMKALVESPAGTKPPTA
jgi:2-keto-4-pentenoate hydratase/2-oxohepta-3-ene-1,7-dioic acid hydratase in catechol pathway